MRTELETIDRLAHAVAADVYVADLERGRADSFDAYLSEVRPIVGRLVARGVDRFKIRRAAIALYCQE